MIKEHWRKLTDNQKYAFVQMSRADREKALYIHKLYRIKSDLMKNNPELVDHNDGDNIVTRIDQRIQDELEDVDEEDSSEYDDSYDEISTERKMNSRTQ